MTKSKERVVGPICIGHVHVFVNSAQQMKVELVHDVHCPEWCR